GSAPVAAKPKRMVFEHAAEVIVRFYEALKQDDFDQYPSFYSGGILRINEGFILASEEAQRAFFNTLSTLMKREKYFFCSPCNVMMLNYTHALIHLTDRDHIQKMRELDHAPLYRLVLFLMKMIVNEAKKLDEYAEWEAAKKEEAKARKRF
ncbi:hypothetical protein PFISCL1PPCAC_23276, partial [Pristionchus fissidentatus]